MKLITTRMAILEVVKQWKRQYPNAKEDRLRILNELETLDLSKALPEDLEKIIGNPTWGRPPRCTECGERCDKVVEVGETPDYGSEAAWLCENCVKKMAKLLWA